MKKEIEQKIEKLLALSGSDNPNEAKAALLKAQELMLKHNVCMEHIKSDVEIGIEQVKTDTRKYTARMAVLIAKNFRTKTWCSKGYINFMGFRDDAIASRYCLEYIVKEASGCFSKYLYENEDLIDDGIYKSRAKYLYRQWMEGFVSGLADAFDSRKEDPQYALMLTVPIEVNWEYEKLNLRSRSIRIGNRICNEAFDAGYEDGKESINRRSIEGEYD